MTYWSALRCERSVTGVFELVDRGPRHHLRNDSREGPHGTDAAARCKQTLQGHNVQYISLQGPQANALSDTKGVTTWFL
jgi:hypothetical protein